MPAGASGLINSKQSSKLKPETKSQVDDRETPAEFSASSESLPEPSRRRRPAATLCPSALESSRNSHPNEPLEAHETARRESLEFESTPTASLATFCQRQCLLSSSHQPESDRREMTARARKRRKLSSNPRAAPNNRRARLLPALLVLVVIVCCELLPFAGDIIPKVGCSPPPPAASSKASGEPSPPRAFILRDQKLLRATAGNATTNQQQERRPRPGQSPKVKNQITRSQANNGPEDYSNPESAFSLNSLQLSITPRVGQLRVPSESNAILKCLISSSQSMNKLNKKLDIRWSRYMYDENVYEQIESPSSPSSLSPLDALEQNQETTPATSGETVAPESEGFQSINRQQQLRDFQARIRQETNVISDLLIEATLSISPVKFSDNASYYCAATDGVSDSESKAKIDLIALSRPSVRLDRLLPARDSKSALVYWTILSDGNTPIKKTIIMVRNDTSLRGSLHFRQQQQGFEEQQTGSSSSQLVLDSDHNQWQRIEIEAEGQPAQEPPPGFYASDTAKPYESSSSSGDSVVKLDVDVTSSSSSSNYSHNSDYPAYFQRGRWRAGNRHFRNQRSFNLSALLPGVTYSLRRAAINDMGQSSWSYLNRTMPNEIPAQIGEVFVLSRKNDTLVIGWRRPSYDNARTLRYEMQLFDLNRTLTLDANTNLTATTSGSGANAPKTNYMYVFFNLNPGTDYHFHVRACSRAGCSAYSTPKLLATTLDGEPDEPLDVELSCQLDSGRMLVSWLPPVNVRGQLLSYSLHLEASASFRNQSGQWALEEWRSVLETSDNHTLSLETPPNIPLKPNTNYTVRVCANNRSKHCGRLSYLGPKSQCSTGRELPLELPEKELKLSLRNLNELEPATGSRSSSAGGDESKIESLVLEMPFVSRRNGSIDCIQIVLIRLPKTYTEFANLASFLPGEPGEIKLSEFKPEDLANPKAEELADAYLAEELDSRDFAGETSPVAKQQIVLGDGTQNVCRHLFSGGKLIDDLEPGAKKGSAEEATRAPRRLRVFDKSLRAQTYYSGFIKLLMSRPKLTPNSTAGNQPVELLARYSHYFRPAKTGASVIEVPPMDYLLEGDSDNSSGGVAGNPFGSINSKMSLREMLGRLGSGLSVTARRAYGQTSGYLNEHFRLDLIGNYLRQTSPVAQVLSVALLFTSFSLMIIFVCWLSRLAGNRRRKRKLKLKRKLQKHQEALASQQAFMQQQQHSGGNAYLLNEGQPANLNMNLVQQFAQPEVPFHGEDHQTAYAKECPIHSSPLAPPPAEVEARQVARMNGCQVPNLDALDQIKQPAYQESLYNNNNNTHHHQHYNGNHNNFNHSNYQFANHELVARQEHYERNCRTLRRLDQEHFAPETVKGGNGAAKSSFTLSQGNVVSTLAKKFNKSLPLRLFGAVFERRLRNGWLAEEYEQLPRPALRPEEGEGSRCWLRLRPQMVVSRDDSISALISGRDSIDASLIKPPPTEWGLATESGCQQMARGKLPERRIICAKSPLDADSVWDFWRLIYEQEVSTLVMLTQTEDLNSGELRCAQYWPTQDNEETTILSPCNDYVQKSAIPPAKFKIRQETFESESRENDFKIRRLTLVVMATKPSENQLDQSTDDLARADETGSERKSMQSLESSQGGAGSQAAINEDDADMVIVERLVWHLQFYHWNTSTLNNQMRLIKFVELANERHSRSLIQESPSMEAQLGPMLVHCYTGLGRSGLFTAMSFVVDELSLKLGYSIAGEQMLASGTKQQQADQAKLNLFQLVSRLRLQRDMIISPYRFYELLYQLTANCIPNQELLVANHNHHHHHHHHANHQHQHYQRQPAPIMRS